MLRTKRKQRHEAERSDSAPRPRLGGIILLVTRAESPFCDIALTKTHGGDAMEALRPESERPHAFRELIWYESVLLVILSGTRKPSRGFLAGGNRQATASGGA